MLHSSVCHCIFVVCGGGGGGSGGSSSGFGGGVPTWRCSGVMCSGVIFGSPRRTSGVQGTNLVGHLQGKCPLCCVNASVLCFCFCFIIEVNDSFMHTSF